jgi:hypothetical protein
VRDDGVHGSVAVGVWSVFLGAVCAPWGFWCIGFSRTRVCAAARLVVAGDPRGGWYFLGTWWCRESARV